MKASALIDNRKPKDIKDYSHLEVLGSAGEVKWLTKSKALKMIQKTRNQKSTSSCGASAMELIMGSRHGTLLEPAFIYRLRANYSGEGMYHYDVGNIAKLNGACEYLGIEKTEASYNAYNPTESQKKEALKYRMGDYVVLTDNAFDIDQLAYITNNLNSPIHLFVYWKNGEWTATPTPKGKLSVTETENRHYATVWCGYKEKGKKHLLVQDTAHFGNTDVRHIQDDWVQERTYTGLYFTNFKYEQSEVKEKPFIFTRDLKYGDNGEDVRMLQTYMQKLGFMPTEINGEKLEPTIYFRGLTRQAVKDFQKKYEESILWSIGLKTPTGIFGKSTRNKLMEVLSSL
jgi:hypothetical protein